MNSKTNLPENVSSVEVPGSKSLTQRALIAAALATGESLLRGALIAEDTLRLMEGLKLLGARLEQDVSGIRVIGTGGVIANPDREIFLGNNGTALRFLTALVCLGRGMYVLTGEPRLLERPVGPLVDALKDMGVKINCRNNCPPVTVSANGLKGGQIALTDIESSQYVSALLLCAPCTAKGIELSLTGNIVSAPYIDLTVGVMKDFGAKITQTDRQLYRVGTQPIYSGRIYDVEGDASSASYFFLAAALLRRPVRVYGIRRDSAQGDIGLLDVLEKLGCRIESGEAWVEVSAPGGLAAGDVTLDMGNMPDMVPTVGVLAAYRRGKTVITNAAHLRIKESNRLAAMASELGRMGIAASERPDGLTIEGGSPVAANIETYNDHRIAMSFAVAGLVTPGIRIADKKCVEKSFPGFWRELAKL
ncbi:MAG: 3-phosphoshikimate 1-carboxyvinyltransferase [Smithellaceae bacterium]|jgi:3-phosphoshikimate 1-carboxyvinyltransferase|nr:3-phosphoshikimate 1-carboxyvinyltransferase [Smithellaceae bacterium]MDD3847843.1 3-phosphoshikimate 1-carboxyvinyltransferase [Smithellaceae bacterium]HOQ71480.1 3-phosphoshikimate 1-carboxyvinyltransferase [Smithellaceae bacterium]HPL10355.1 3-phosphoshikimate 1-carboxyvinyltransferase [Smithellaceae bacterium]